MSPPQANGHRFERSPVERRDASFSVAPAAPLQTHQKDGSSASPQLPPISLLKARDEIGLQVSPDNRMVLWDRETERRSVMNATEQRHDLPQGS